MSINHFVLQPLHNGCCCVTSAGTPWGTKGGGASASHAGDDGAGCPGPFTVVQLLAVSGSEWSCHCGTAAAAGSGGAGGVRSAEGFRGQGL